MTAPAVPVTAAGPPARDVDWRPAAAAVAWIPDGHREPSVPLVVARRMLRCSESSLQQLLDLGLPAAEGPEGPLFDPRDLKNAGLYSGSGGTDVEVAMRLVLGFLRSDAAELTRPKRWTFRLGVAGAAAARSVFRPAPERFGGSFDGWDAGRPAPDVDGPYVRVAPGAEVAGSMTSRGAEDPVRSPEIRELMREVVDGGIRWHYLPESLERRPDEALALGVANCAVLCTVLERRLRDAGYDARSYRGWILALAQSEHSWVEVVDDDGATKCLDPSLAVLADRNGFGSPGFRELAFGSRLNRIAPTAAPLDGGYAADLAPGETVTFTCQAVRQP